MGASSRSRLDQRVVKLGLVPSRVQAQELIATGLILVNGAVAEKPSRLVLPGDAIEVIARRKYVGRGGVKLEGAIAQLKLDVSGMRCLDVGSSTGGFIDCLLSLGAAQVRGVDVGRSQIHESVLRDARVKVWEGVDVREAFHLLTSDSPEGFDLITCDVSFISLRGIASSLAELAQAGASCLLALVKPQFEVGQRHVSRGEGVIVDPALWLTALMGVAESLSAQGFIVGEIIPSVLKGAKGNQEFFLSARWTPGPAEQGNSLPTLVQSAIEMALAEPRTSD